MNKPQLYIDPECRLSKVPYEVPNNTHYVKHEDYLSLRKAGEVLVEAINETARKTFYPYELRLVHERAIRAWIEANDAGSYFHPEVTVNHSIPKNPHPVQPPPDMPPPKKKDEREDIDWKRKCEELESEVMILKSNIVVIGQAFDRFENGLLNTPDWVKQADLRDTINKSRHF